MPPPPPNHLQKKKKLKKENCESGGGGRMSIQSETDGTSGCRQFKNHGVSVQDTTVWKWVFHNAPQDII